MIPDINPSALFVSLIGIVFGVIFIISSFKIKKRVEEEVFKNYFKWLSFSSIAFTIGFMGDIAKYFLGETLAEPIHHIFLIISISALAVAGFTLSQEIKK
ncbi:MAG: hypothetical protein QMD50_02055 [Patescibacteria group bacterium]|nr:hypothetical protein [Patescibacteria group bacterium]